MSKYTAWQPDTEVKDYIIQLADKYPEVFGHVEADKIGIVRDMKKKNASPVCIKSVVFPESVWIDRLVYIMTVYDDVWGILEKSQKGLAVAQVLCSIPKDGFIESSKGYAKKISPDIKTYMEVFALSGGVPNWMENVSAKDPLE